jgi:hypothetical protein
MPHAPRHSGGFSQGQSVIGGFTPPTTPAQNTGQYGAFFGAGASSDPIPGGTTQPASGNQFSQYQQAADTMQQAGIGSLSGATTDTTQGQAAAAIQNAFQQSQGTDTSGSGTDTSSTDDEGKGLVETLLSNTTVANLLKGVQSTDRFFKNLSEKGVDGLSTEDKIILANLIGAGGLDTIDLNKYTTDDVDFEELGKRFTEAASGLENVDYQSLVDSYLSNKPTGIDSLTTMGSDLFNLFGDPRLLREDGSYTLEGLKEELGPEGIAYLKATNPKLYYSFTDPQTSGGLAELAQFDLSTLGNSPEDRRLAARVMAAREATSNQGGGQGIVAAAPFQPIGIVPRPGPIVPDPTDPTDPVIPMPIMTPATGTPFSSNYFSNLPQFNFSEYAAKRGVPSLINYNDILRRFYG